MKQTTILLLVVIGLIGAVAYRCYRSRLPLVRWINVTFLGEATGKEDHGVTTLKDQKDLDEESG